MSNQELIPLNSTVGNPLSKITEPELTILGWSAAVLFVALPALPLWSYHVVTNPSPLPTNVSKLAVSNMLLAKPISCSTLSEDLRTLIAEPV